MSVCLESSLVQKPVNNGTGAEPLQQLDSCASPCTPIKEESIIPPKNLAKLVLTTIAPTTNSALLQKVATSSVITVVNATGPFAFFKNLSSNPGGPSTPQFSLVNSVGNAIGKPITVVTAPPIAVVKAIPNVKSPVTQVVEESCKEQEALTSSNSSSGLLATNSLTDRPPIHNVFVKNTAVVPELVVSNDSEGEKITETSIQSHVIKAPTSVSISKLSNGPTAEILDTNKIKIVGNVLVSPTPSVITSVSSNPSNIILNKTFNSKPYLPQKMITNSSLNGAPKFINKTVTVTNNITKVGTFNNTKPQKLIYPTHKSQIRTMPQINNNVLKQGIKTIPPQSRGILNQQVQRTGMGLRTIPPQRPKMANKPNYIGKHAIQAQKFRNSHGIGKVKNIKPPVPSNNVFPHRTPQNTGVTYHQALTANIIQSLTENTSGRPYDFSTRYDSFNEVNQQTNYSDAYNVPPATKPQSNLEALSFVCQAVLLDHNYNATPPAETHSTRPVPSTTSSMQVNGGSSVSSYYSPSSNTRNRTSSLGNPPNTLATLTSTSNTPLPISTHNANVFPDDDAASDISCGSDRKAETEGEETDTAPEAEAVGNEDHYGDYVTRCICGFLHDDGYMIECDKCKVWQHVRCVIKSAKKLPEDYFCEMCDSTKTVDRSKARTAQQQWMRENQDVKFKKESRIKDLKVKEVMSDSDTSEGEAKGDAINNKSRIGITTRRKSENNLRPVSRQRRDSKSESNARRTFKRKERKVTRKKPKLSVKSQSEDELPEVLPQQTILQMPQLRQWIEHYEEAVTNHYSPELRARISSIRVNGAYSDLSTHLYSNLNKCRVFTQPLTSLKYLVTTMHLLPNTPVIELRGKYMLLTQHRGSVSGHTGSLTTRQHAQRPGPFLFFYRLPKDNTEVCVDTRTYGNDARFIRRSCKPNSELRHCIEKGVLHLYIVGLDEIDANVELTIKHEAHDLAAVGTTLISCACGKPNECTINNNFDKKNGEVLELPAVRKRRGRRTTSSASELPNNPVPIKEEELDNTPTTPESPTETKPSADIKPEPENEISSEEIKPKEEIIVKKEKIEYPMTPPENIIKDEDVISSPSPPLTRRLSQFTKSEDNEEKKESLIDSKKKSREERKIEAYMKAFERMERLQQRRQEHQAKQAHRRESEPCPYDEKGDAKLKRRRRRGRARTISTTSQSRSTRINSADSCYGTSGDECLLSPTDSIGNSKDTSCESSPIKEKDCSLSTSFINCNSRSDMKSPIQDVDCNSNCANSPETSLSSACLLVAAAVEPLERGFKFPKTKKGMMNEWLNKSPDGLQQSTLITPQSPAENLFETTANGFYGATKSITVFSSTNNICDASQLHCNAKKRWLRQAISEDQNDSPNSRPDSPPISEMVAPPKKRRLPRESISNDNSPPSTPTNSNGPTILNNTEDLKEQEDRVEIITADGDGDSPTEVLIDDATLKDRVAEMQQEIGSCFRLPLENAETFQKDPRLIKTVLNNNSEHLVATPEKDLTVLVFEEHNREAVPAPAKRKLSINEYRQRKQLCVNEKAEEPSSDDLSNAQPLSPTPKQRSRSDSTSSSSFMSSDDEIHLSDLPKKTLSAFNSEPTELEKQREGVGLRLKKAFGLSINEDAARKPVLDMEAILNCDLAPPIKRLYSPTFPGPGSIVESPSLANTCTEDSNSKLCDTTDVEMSESAEQETIQRPQVSQSDSVKPEMFYTPDDDEKESSAVKDEVHIEESKKCCDFNSDSTNYIPPFNNPVYPNNSFASFGSVIDDAPYEGRNPSPPPDLSSTVPVSFSPS